MRKLNKYIFSKNISTVGVAMIFVWLGFSGLSGLFVRDPDKVFLYFGELVVFSFLSAGITVKIIHKILMTKISFQDILISPLWLFVIVLGSFIFTAFAQKTFFVNLEFFAGVFVLGLIPAALFRLLLNFLKYFLHNSGKSGISIINE